MHVTHDANVLRKSETAHLWSERRELLSGSDKEPPSMDRGREERADGAYVVGGSELAAESRRCSVFPIMRTCSRRRDPSESKEDGKEETISLLMDKRPRLKVELPGGSVDTFANSSCVALVLVDASEDRSTERKWPQVVRDVTSNDSRGFRDAALEGLSKIKVFEVCNRIEMLLEQCALSVYLLRQDETKQREEIAVICARNPGPRTRFH